MNGTGAIIVAITATIVKDQCGPITSYIFTEAGLSAPDTMYREKVMKPSAEAAYCRYTKIMYM